MDKMTGYNETQQPSILENGRHTHDLTTFGPKHIDDFKITNDN